MSFEITDRVSPVSLARITGAFYLSFMASSVLANALGHVGLGDTPQVRAAITSDPGRFRVALVCAFASAFLFLMAAWGLYVLLRPVNRDLALLFLLLNTVGVAVQCASMLALVSALLRGDAGGTTAAFPQLQADALVRGDIDVYRTGFVVAQLFFGTWLFPLGYLVWKSGFLPRFLGALLVLDGVGELVWFLQALLLPDRPGITTPGTAVSLLAEVGLTLWLLVRGVTTVETAPVAPPSVAVDAGVRGAPR